MRLIEGKYDKEFLEKTSIYNARHYCIYEIIKLKRCIQLSEDFESGYNEEYLLEKIKAKLKNRVSKEALEMVEELYNANGDVSFIKKKYKNFENLREEVKAVLK